MSDLKIQGFAKKKDGSFETNQNYRQDFQLHALTLKLQTGLLNFIALPLKK